MVVGIKDTVKLIGILVIAGCAVFVCTLFLNYNIDIAVMKGEITTEAGMAMYQAQVSTGKVVAAVSGGCLVLTSVVMLLFYIKNYIDTHSKELGILKALGYSGLKIAKHFWVFGLSVFVGCGIYIGFLLSAVVLCAAKRRTPFSRNQGAVPLIFGVPFDRYTCNRFFGLSGSLRLSEIKAPRPRSVERKARV